MASSGTASMDVTYSLEGADLVDLQRLADIVDAHGDLTLVEKNESMMTVTATVVYDITVDASTDEFTATRQDTGD